MGILLIGIFLSVALSYKIKNGIPDKDFQRIRQRWLSAIKYAFGIKIQPFGVATQQPALWISNHISWADIAVIGTAAKIGFLSKTEVKHWPVVGWIIARGGTLFISRGGKNAASAASKEITHHIRNLHSILIFPEGTTTNGKDVRHFHARLLAPALDHQILIQPVALKYFDSEGNRSESIAFVDDMSFLDSAWRILTTKKIYAQLHFLPTVDSAKFSERKKLAQQLQLKIAEAVKA